MLGFVLAEQRDRHAIVFVVGQQFDPDRTAQALGKRHDLLQHVRLAFVGIVFLGQNHIWVQIFIPYRDIAGRDCIGHFLHVAGDESVIIGERG